MSPYENPFFSDPLPIFDSGELIPNAPNITNPIKLHILIKINRKKSQKIKSPQSKEIGIQYGRWILTIAPINPDSLRTQESAQTLIHTMRKRDIDSPRIQERLNERIGPQEYDNYNIYCGWCDINHKSEQQTNNGNNCIDFVSIAIRKTLVAHFLEVVRINSRIMEIGLKTDNKINNIAIINSYAPPN